MHEEAWKNRTLKLTSSKVNPVRWALTQGNYLRLRSLPEVMRPYLATHCCKKKHKPQVRCKMIVCKMTIYKTIQFTRLRATNEDVRNGKRTNLKKLPRPHKLPQGASTESVEGGVKIGETCLPPIGRLCISKVLEKGQPPQRHRLPTISK